MARDWDPMYEIFWLSNLAAALVLLLGGDITVTAAQLKSMLERDISWERVGDDYRIKVR